MFSAKYGQSTGVVVFEDVFVPHERVFLAGEWGHTGHLTTTYATHHRHSCIGARAGFGDLLIGAGVLMIESNGLDLERHGHVREAMVELIKIVEGFFACGVAASVYGSSDPAGNAQPDAVFSQHRQAAARDADLRHAPAGPLRLGRAGRGAARPGRGPQPDDAASLATVLRGAPRHPGRAARCEVARLMEDLTASYTGGWYSVISLHGGGSPEAMKREIYRQYPLEEKAALVEDLLDRGVSSRPAPKTAAQPGRCCAVGCQVPEPLPALTGA